MQIYMKFKKDTKNKHVFVQCDEAGEVIDPIDATITALYIAKNSLKTPVLYITVDITDGLVVTTDV